MQEIWKPVIGEEGRYEVSNLGRIRSLDREVTQTNQAGTYTRIMKGKILKPQANTKGYEAVSISGKGSKLLHRIVAEAFIQNPNNLPQVNHKDTNKRNNRADNLEWVDNSGNQQHAIATGVMRKATGEDYKNSVLTEDTVRWIRDKHIKGDKEWGSKGLALKLGLNPETVRNAITGRTWKHVK